MLFVKVIFCSIRISEKIFYPLPYKHCGACLLIIKPWENLASYFLGKAALTCYIMCQLLNNSDEWSKEKN